MNSVSLRLQDLPQDDQVLVLARLAETQEKDGRFAPGHLDGLFDDAGLPRPARTSNNLARLERARLAARQKNVKGRWRLTPRGRQRSIELIDDMGMALLNSEMSSDPAWFGHVRHPTLPPWLAPPELLAGLHDFLADFPFEENVFAMTRFPDEQDDSLPDPVAAGLEEARSACKAHGLTFHLASDRKIVDDLWANVLAHTWGCRYGIGFFEDRRGRGVNYNLTIEVGSMLAMGRRIALLKDSSIDSLPTDLVGRIYTSVDLTKLGDVSSGIHAWLRDDLRLGACSSCT